MAGTIKQAEIDVLLETVRDWSAGKYVGKVSGKGLSTNDYTTEEKNKLSGIASGAEVNVNADWTATSGDAEILNKPTKLSYFTDDLGSSPTHTHSQYLTEHQSLANYSTTTEMNTAISNHHDSTKLDASKKGAVNGVAELDANGKVPSSQLPSYVDDVLEYNSKSAFPATGETGKIYVAKDDNKTYRWGGTEYVEISASLALGETESTAYRGDRGKTAYDHSQDGTVHVTASDKSNWNGKSVVSVSSTGTATETVDYITINGVEKKIAQGISSVAWGSITGTLSNQSDLNTALSGKYVKPSGGIPKTDLASAVQTSLDKADTALQSETYTGTVTSVRVQATSPVVSSQNTAQTATLNTTISLADGYGDTKNPYASKTANYVLSAPNGSAGVPSFRPLVTNDISDMEFMTSAEMLAILNE